MASKRLAVIGAGPMGLEAALRGVERGWAVTVFEKNTVGAHPLKWAHVRLFTPLKDNISPLFLKNLSHAPDLNSCLTGREFAEQVLVPVSNSPALQGKVREKCEVLAIAKRRMIKTEMPGHPLRAERPFQLLVRSAAGEEIVEADCVLDAGGVYGQANASGESGLPCPGERDSSLITRHLPDINGLDQKDWLGKKILLIGDGHSAATAVCGFAQLRDQNPETQVHWVVNGDRSRPCVETANDPLPDRRETVVRANDLAEKPFPGWAVHRRSSLLSLKQSSSDFMIARVGRGDKYDDIQIQKILSLTGYRPDLSYLQELQVQVSPVTGGAAGLAKSLLSITDCLSPVVVTPDQLRSGEDGYFMIGHKSYGRLNSFLLRTGLAQIEEIFKILSH
jgi:thioredoxin reductase